MNAKKIDTAQTAAGNGSEAQEPQILPDMSKHNIVPLKDGEKAVSRTVVSADNRVDVWYSLGTNKDINAPHQGYTVFDFSGCSREELLDLACHSPVIGVQRRWATIARSSGIEAATKPGLFSRVDVKRDIIDASRKSAPPTAKVGKLIDKMSEAEKRTTLARLEAELNGTAA